MHHRREVLDDYILTEISIASKEFDVGLRQILLMLLRFRSICNHQALRVYDALQMSILLTRVNATKDN